MCNESEVPDDVWVFGYGSLIWNPDLPHVDRVDGILHGWKRRFWQGSTDHRGTQEAPGRVVTLVNKEQCDEAGITDEEGRWSVFGSAYKLPEDQKKDILEKLDHREKDGYERCIVKIHDWKNPTKVVLDKALIYIAVAGNPSWQGSGNDNNLDVIAAQIAACTGDSGPNSEYLFKLAECLRYREIEDPHVQELEKRVKAIMGKEE
mmetsp:Transcript_6239/g.18827  ORF Transcript_6239/g.18827 Transcript_6239/m.18827 type:complete len:205 (-) Transcript_6239:565-1179(-)